MKETKKKEKHSRPRSIQYSSMTRIASWTGLFNLRTWTGVLESFPLIEKATGRIRLWPTDAPWGWISEPVLGGRLYARSDRFTLPSLSDIVRTTFLRSTFGPRFSAIVQTISWARRSRFWTCIKTHVYGTETRKWITERRNADLIGDFQLTEYNRKDKYWLWKCRIQWRIKES